MGLSQSAKFALSISAVGGVSFFLGVFAEYKKPLAGEATTLKDIVICHFPHDRTVLLGSLSFIFLILTTVIGIAAVFFPYNGKSIPAAGLFRTTNLLVFFVIATVVSLFAGFFLLFATITESFHILHNVHHDLSYNCPTAKTGLFGGGGFVALDAALFWLICQMLTSNARADYEDEDPTGDYSQLQN